MKVDFRLNYAAINDYSKFMMQKNPVTVSYSYSSKPATETSFLVKFRYSEKSTKISKKKSHFALTLLTNFKIKWEIFSRPQWLKRCKSIKRREKQSEQEIV